MAVSAQTWRISGPPANPYDNSLGSYWTIPVTAVDADGKEIEGSVGNGSKIRLTVAPYKWSFKGKSGVSPSIIGKLVVTELIKYESPSEEATAL